MYALLKTQIERFGLFPRFDIQQKKIYHRYTGTEFMFYGLWRDIMQLKSMEGVDILWIEEGHALTAKQWEILEPTIRTEGSQVWLVFNPDLATDFAYERFVANPPPDTIVRLINYDENPFLSKTALKVIAAAKAEDEEEFNHIYLGQPRENDDSVIIKRSWIEAAVDAHVHLNIAPTGRHRMGFDIADSGNDKCATISVHGMLAHSADMWKGGEDELLMSCTRVYNAALQDGSHVLYDSIGVGAMAGAKFGELNAARTDGNRITYAKYNAGSAVWRPESNYTPQTKNKDHFANLKAQAWWLVADRFRNTYNAIRNGQQFNEDELISISSDLPHLALLKKELSTPRRDFNALGKVKVESKEDLAKTTRKGGSAPSPNLADAFVSAFAPGLEPMRINTETLNKSRKRK